MFKSGIRSIHHWSAEKQVDNVNRFVVEYELVVRLIIEGDTSKMRMCM